MGEKRVGVERGQTNESHEFLELLEGDLSRAILVKVAEGGLQLVNLLHGEPLLPLARGEDDGPINHQGGELIKGELLGRLLPGLGEHAGHLLLRVGHIALLQHHQNFIG